MVESININGREVVVVDKEALMDLIYKTATVNRQEDRKGICSAKEAMKILGCGSTKFYKMLSDPKCKIRRSNVNGKYIKESVIQERDRG